MSMESGAILSPCGAYRYQLWRKWSNDPLLAFVMLNPSTADASVNDPTINRCIRRAIMMQFGGIVVANLFALRAANPKMLKTVEDPVGKINDSMIIATAVSAAMVICAWGAHGKFMNRNVQVLQLLRETGITPSYLEMNNDGTPKHPLYIGYNVEPKLWLASCLN